MIRLERLRQVASYDELTGQFVRVEPVKGKRVGNVMGSKRWDGYIRIRIDRHFYYGHRLAWFWCNGVWPAEEIDHIDGDPSNNAIANLRSVSRTTNQQNVRRAQARNACARLGVAKRADSKFTAQIGVEGKQVHLGSFNDPDEAHAAYVRAKRRLHPGCTI